MKKMILIAALTLVLAAAAVPGVAASFARVLLNLYAVMLFA